MKYKEWSLGRTMGVGDGQVGTGPGQWGSGDWESNPELCCFFFTSPPSFHPRYLGQLSCPKSYPAHHQRQVGSQGRGL